MMYKKVLGLDIGSNSIGFSLLELYEQNNEIKFHELVSNSIVFSEPDSAEDRRNARGSRRRNERKSARNKKARTLYKDYKIASNEFVKDTSRYLNSLDIEDKDVYKIREAAVNGTLLTKDEFIFCTYSILTDRGYSNMFSISNEDGVINEAVSKNAKEYEEKKLALPSMVLTAHRKELENQYQNIPIRNKKDDYKNSLDRAMHMEEFKKVVQSQANNTNIFNSSNECQKFIEEITDESEINTPFYQRALKSFEGMVEYCSFYDEFNPLGSHKKTPLSNIRNIELTLRQKIDNHDAIIGKTGEVKKFSKEEIDKIVDFWIQTPSSNEINAGNIFKSVGFKDVKLNIAENSSQVVLNIVAHRNILEVLNKYEIDFMGKDNDFYNDILLELYYFKNDSSRIEHIKKHIEKYALNIEDEFAQELAYLDNMDSFASFSLKFTNEVLAKMKDEDKTHYEALASLGYYSKYLGMPTYDYLPPLEPTKKDVEWLYENVKGFENKHLFYQPMISPKTKRVIAVLRKLVNELIVKYGRIDEIRIETAKEMNSKTEKEKIDKNQAKDKKKNEEASRFLKANDIKDTRKNLLRAKLYIEQGKDACLCLYSGEPITLEDAFDEEETEVEHFIPRSVIWIDSYKNKILIKKKANQNKSSDNPVSYLKSIAQWDNFRARVEDTFMPFNKKDWLTKEDAIESIMNKEHWQESYLNDTRSATRVIQKYLNHYLYPQENLHGKEEKRHIFSVSGRAISELKYMWGIHTIMPKNEDNKKDRSTNYHHTLDAFTIALCSSAALTTLHNFFIKKENKYKTEALKEKLASNLPHSTEGENVVEYLKNLVQRYETNKLYVCPYNKRKTNMKGFKDGNLKLYITKDKENSDILAEMEKVSIDTSLLIKIVGGFPKDRNDAEVRKEIQSIQERLNPQKQKKIMEALDVYVEELLALRTSIALVEKEIDSLKKGLKTGKQYKEVNEIVKENMKPYIEQKEALQKQLHNLKCSFSVKGGKRQIVKSLKLYNTKVTQTKADAILFPHRENNKIERLSLVNFTKALQDKEPFVIKANESTLNVKLFNTSQGQKVGLDYFSGEANKNISTKINPKNEELVKYASDVLTLYKNDIIKVNNIKTGIVEYFIFNGGGNITATNNKLTIKNINTNTFIKKDKKGGFKKTAEDNVTPNNINLISKVKIDFFGNINEV